MSSKNTWITGGCNTPTMAAGTTLYFQVGSGANMEGTTESWVSTKCQIAGVWSKMTISTAQNNRTNTTTVRTRKNNVAAGMTISIPTVSTGTFQAATGSDTVAINDSYDFNVVTGGGGGGSGTIMPSLHSFMFTHASNSITKFVGKSGSVHNEFSLISPNYWPYPSPSTYSGRLHSNNFSLKRLGVSSSANTRTGTNTYQVTKDTITGFSPTGVAPTVVFNAAETGEKVDLTGVHSVVDADADTEYAYGILCTLNGGSGTFTGRSIYVYFDSTEDDFYIAPVMATGKVFGSGPYTLFLPLSHWWIYNSTESLSNLISPIQFTIKEATIYWRNSECTTASQFNLRVNGIFMGGNTIAAGVGYTIQSMTGLPITINVGDLLNWWISVGTGSLYIDWIYIKCTTYYPPPPVVNIKTVSYINRTVQGIS